MKVIFLDHDGVICLLTEWGSRFKNKEGLDSIFDRFNGKAIKVLNQIIEETDCEIVVSSDWRFQTSLEQMKELYRIRDIKKVPIDYTPNMKDFDEHGYGLYTWKGFYEDIRVREINEYLKTHPQITNWVTVDDMNLSMLSHFVQTTRSNEGIKQCGIKDKIIKFLK